MELKSVDLFKELRPSEINVIGGVTKIARDFKYFHKLIYRCLKCMQ